MDKQIRTGVYICHCGENIAGTVDVEKVAEYARGLGSVVVARPYMFMCSDPGQGFIKNDIKELGFYEAMNKYNINLMVDKRYQDNFISLTSLFSEDIDQDAYNRTKIIQSKLFKNKNNYDEDTRNLYNELNIKRYFKNIGSVQDVAIYKIIESSSSL